MTTKTTCALSVLMLTGCSFEEPCARGHTETRTREAWIQYVQVGKLTMPILHPASEYQEFVCDQTWQELELKQMRGRNKK